LLCGEGQNGYIIKGNVKSVREIIINPHAKFPKTFSISLAIAILMPTLFQQ